LSTLGDGAAILVTEIDNALRHGRGGDDPCLVSHLQHRLGGSGLQIDDMQMGGSLAA